MYRLPIDESPTGVDATTRNENPASTPKSIVDFLANQLTKDGLVCLIQYGSSLVFENPNDYDFMALCSKVLGVFPISIGSLDLCKMSLKRFSCYARNLDPIYCTESLLTGRVVLGNQEVFSKFQETVKATKPGPNVVSYLVRQSVAQYSTAIDLLDMAPFEALYSLKFSVGYYMFANWYERGNGLTTLHQLKDQLKNDFPRLLFKKVALGKRKSLSKEEVIPLIKRWERVLASSPVLFG